MVSQFKYDVRCKQRRSISVDPEEDNSIIVDKVDRVAAELTTIPGKHLFGWIG
jgi:hypothetical protein